MSVILACWHFFMILSIEYQSPQEVFHEFQSAPKVFHDSTFSTEYQSSKQVQ